MAIETSVKYERLIRKHASRFRFVEVVDLHEKLQGGDKRLAAYAWLQSQRAPFCKAQPENSKCLAFRGTPSAQRRPLVTKGILESFLDVQTELDLVRFVKRYGPLGQAVPKDKYLPTPPGLEWAHYEPIADLLGLAALFRTVREQIHWLSRCSDTVSPLSPLAITFGTQAAERDEFKPSRASLPFAVTDQHFRALWQVFTDELAAWWNYSKALRVLWDADGTRKSESSSNPSSTNQQFNQWGFDQEVNKSVFLHANSTHRELQTDMFVREVLNQLITSETRIEIGKGGFVFTNLSLLGVLANQLGALYRGRGSLGRICIGQGCDEIIDPKRRSDAVYCPKCKPKFGSKRQNERKRAARQHM